MASITLRNVRKSFGETNVLHGVSLDVADGECVVFVGPSGCGKSTLLRLICGLEEVTSGTISIAEEVVNDVPPSKRGIAMVFQSYALYPHMSVAENMGYALRLAGETREAIRARVEKAAAILRLDALLDRKPRQLSGGQRQRVAIGRAIVREPRVFLFDEPLSNLDAALRVDMRAEIAALKARLGTTMVYVTHDQIEAMTLADKIVVMNAGRIEQVGAPLELYHRPANLFVAGFIGSPRMNLLPLTRGAAGEAVLPGGASLPLPAPVPAGNLTLGIRPEHLTLAPSGAGLLKGTALVVEHLGSDAFTHINLDGMADRLILRLDGTQEIKPGARVDLTFALADAHLFDANGMRIAAPPAMGVAA
jgi:ABC-type sugar transport system ATPase subunit